MNIDNFPSDGMPGLEMQRNGCHRSCLPLNQSRVPNVMAIARKSMKTRFLCMIPCAVVLGLGMAQAVTIDTVYFGQTHVLKPDNPYFGLVSNREALIKAHVVDPATPASPAVIATLTLAGQTLNLPLSGPPTLPASIPDGLGVVQHSYANSFTAIIPAAWVKPGLNVTVTAGAANVSFPNLKIGAPTKVIMRMFDIHYFALTPGDYPAGWKEEIEAKWPVAELEVRRLPNVVFPMLVIPPRPDVNALAARVKSQSDYTVQTGLGFDGEQAAALEWNGALKRAGGKSGRLNLSFINIYGANAGGQAGGFSGVGNGTFAGILHHELGHALSLPHWGDSAAYLYKGAMFGIAPPDNYNETHAGPAWAFDLPTRAFIAPTVQPNNVGGHPVGTYKIDPMQGGGTGWQEPPFLLNHFSDYSVNQMRNYLEGQVLVWNQTLGSYAAWNQATAGYTSTVSNNGVNYPLERDVDVITVMASISGAKPDVNMVYPPIGPYVGGLIKLFDPRVAADRTSAQSIFAPAGGCDISLGILQGGIEKTYMLAAPWEPTLDPHVTNSLKTEAVNLRASDGPVTRVEMLLTPDAQINGLPANPQVLYTWAPVTPDPSTFSLFPTAGSSSAITMRATAGTSTGAPVEYLFTETSGNAGGTSSGWQSSSSFTDIGLQPQTTYAYTVTMRAGTYTGRPSAVAYETTQAVGSAGTITFNGSASWTQKNVPGTYDASSSDKLVVAVAGEHNFPNNYTGDVTGITYNGHAMVKAVDIAPNQATHGQTTADIWYLDNPGAYAGPGTIVVSFLGTSWCATAIGLSGTEPGVGSTAIADATAAVNLTTSGDNSMVIAVFGGGGSGNTATPAPPAVSPLTPINGTVFPLFYTGISTGYRAIGSPSSQSFAFSTTKTDVVTIAAEFIAAPLPPDYNTWAALYPAANLTDPAADLDGDGVANNDERLFGLDPTSRASSNPITIPLNAAAGTFSYTRRSPALTGFNCTVWTSTNLQAWSKDNGAAQTPGTADANGIQTVAVTLSPTLLSQPRLFVQVQAAN